MHPIQKHYYSRLEQALSKLGKLAGIDLTAGILLLLSAILALILANSSISGSYHQLWETKLGLRLGDYAVSKPAIEWINEGLMTLFFLLVSLEIKREFLVGELRSARSATLPIAAALGGMLAPAALYLIYNADTKGAVGWGIPMATDIVFVIGTLSIIRGIPRSLRIFLVTLAIVDDIGAIIVIAVFYSASTSFTSFIYVAVVLTLLIAANLSGTRIGIVYVILGILLWIAFLNTGVHATMAGVLLGLAIPARAPIDTGRFLQHSRQLLDRFEAAGETGRRVLTNSRRQDVLEQLSRANLLVDTPLRRMEHALRPWVILAIMPLFALANAGIRLEGGLDSLFHPVAIGVITGLVIGKQLGITTLAWLAVATGLATLPRGIRWTHIYGASWVAGIGFTVSLFISDLAFPSSELLSIAKIGILTGSVVAGLGGLLILRSVSGSKKAGEEVP